MAMVSNGPHLQTSTSTQQSSNFVESSSVPNSITYDVPQDVCSNITNILHLSIYQTDISIATRKL